MNIPLTFQTKIVGAFGQAGEDWLEALEQKVQYFLEKWSLTSEGPVSNLSYNYVLKATDSQGRAVVLKLGIPGFDFNNEIKTVQAYKGEGCAKLLLADAEQGAMLLERLSPGIMLADEKDEELVLHEYANVWRALRRPVPADVTFPTIMDWASGLTRYQANYRHDDGPIAKDLIVLADTFFRELTETCDEPELLHGDLHHENILYAEDRGWLAIDPKGLVGDRYFDTVSFLVNHLHTKPNPKDVLTFRVDFLVKNLGLDRVRLLKAAVAMSILSACWGIEDKDPDWEHTYKYAKWFHDMLVRYEG
ncbi:kinase [Bacillus sp. HMF5848]|uniref:aminoglycoside phosphotransferase family protein n=1 Tax=Bacillus sp. HMF5848 TaxID=2495421 RepID=UPI000F77EDB1|nr:aminoglycoside phosphotransferase family protein [Bacillus sp. HMF5848]RSK27601.1 kinase [Bacillus sp. HMF5848]